MEKATNWSVVEPGVIELEMTDIRIKHVPDNPNFFVEWKGNQRGSYFDLENAKSYAMKLLNELCAMGYEP